MEKLFLDLVCAVCFSPFYFGAIRLGTSPFGFSLPSHSLVFILLSEDLSLDFLSREWTALTCSLVVRTRAEATVPIGSDIQRQRKLFETKWWARGEKFMVAVRNGMFVDYAQYVRRLRLYSSILVPRNIVLLYFLVSRNIK
jgi:hypothetical protein